MICGASLLLFFKKCVLWFFFSYLRKITILNVSENSLDELLRNQTASKTHINMRNDPIFFFFFIFTLAFPAQILSLVHVLKKLQLLQFLRFQGLFIVSCLFTTQFFFYWFFLSAFIFHGIFSLCVCLFLFSLIFVLFWFAFS